MDLGLKGKVALVSGASAGMGLATARELAAEGARVVLVARREAPLEAAVTSIRQVGGEAIWVSADMTLPADVTRSIDAARAAFGMPDIAISNVIPIHRYGLDDASDEDFRLAFDQIVMSQVYLARQLIPSMREKGWGRLINISTVAVKEPHRWLNLILSTTGRVGAMGMNKVLANENAEFGITVNSLLPGLIDTGVAEAVASGTSERAAPELIEPMPRIPLGRPGTPEEVAGMCVFLASERASYITGQAIAVDGGWLKGLY